jgi:hypothetical protein
MKNSTSQRLAFSSISGKEVTGVFDEHRVTSDAGVLLLREVDRHIKLMDALVDAIVDSRHPSYVRHEIYEMLAQRVFQIGLGYNDANDCDALKGDPAFKIAVGRDPTHDPDLASQPTISRLENMVTPKDLLRIAYALCDHFIASYQRRPKVIVIDMDCTTDVVHGEQQLRLFNAYENEYCFQPFHVYEGLSGKLITAVLRPGKTPSHREIMAVLKRVVKRLKQAWPKTKFLFRGDSHFAKPKVLDWLESQGLFYLVGLAKNAALQQRSEATLSEVKERYAGCERKVRRYASFLYAAKTWSGPRRVILRAEASARGVDPRFVVTNVNARPKLLYEKLYCSRGAVELMIKDHKRHLQSDRTSCHKFEANQFRLFLHSAAYILLHALRSALLKGTELSHAQFDTIRLRLLKIGARVQVLKTKIVFHLPLSFPLKPVLAHCLHALSDRAGGLAPSG